MKNLTVLKFGGSSLATPEQIIAVAKKIKTLHSSGKKIIVVTSAMGKTTNQLVELAKSITATPNRRELDMLLTTGERISMALMSIALHELGCPSISFTGSQAGIMTDGSFSNAKITELKPIRVQAALDENKVVVIAGFQGVDPQSKEITTLGRGGSDTTAVALAAHFQADHCDILKDVDGVMSADPKIIAHAQLIKQISAPKLYEFCYWGAKVLNYRSVAYAVDHCVALGIGRSDTFKIGTQVEHLPPPAITISLKQNPIIHHQIPNTTHAAQQLLAVNSHKFVMCAQLQCSSDTEAEACLKNTLVQSGLPMPQVLFVEHSNGRRKLYLASDENDFTETVMAITNNSQFQVLNRDISTVTASYSDRDPDTFVVPRKDRERAIQTFFTNSV